MTWHSTTARNKQWRCGHLGGGGGDTQQAVEVRSPGGPRGRHGLEQQCGVGREARGQGLTLGHFSAQRKHMLLDTLGA
jgi:hypothetical protein